MSKTGIVEIGNLFAHIAHDNGEYLLIEMMLPTVYTFMDKEVYELQDMTSIAEYDDVTRYHADVEDWSLFGFRHVKDNYFVIDT